MNESLKLAQWANKLKFEDIPSETIRSAKMHLLDFIGGMIYCAKNKQFNSTYFSQVLNEYSSGESTVILNKTKTNIMAAAMLNSLLGHGFELDDFHSASFFHGSSVVIPPVMAYAEKHGAPGKDILTAITSGIETGIRLGLALTVSHNLRGFHPTATIGPFAVVTALSKLKDTPIGILMNAYGIAGSMSSGIKEFYKEGSSVKRYHSSRAVNGGITAFNMAECGITGPSTVIEGDFGFLHAFTDKDDIDKLNSMACEKFYIDEMSIKPYACCGGLHSVIFGLLGKKSELENRASQIKEARLYVCRKVALQNGALSNSSIMATQYSLPFTAALTILRDIHNPQSYNESILNDKDILELAKKIRVYEYDAFNTMSSCIVHIIFNDNSDIRTEVTQPKGYPGNLLTEDEVIGKFMRLTKDAIPENDAVEIVGIIMNLEGEASINRLMGKLF